MFVCHFLGLDIQNKVIQVWNDKKTMINDYKYHKDNWPHNPASIDHLRGSGVRGGPVQASAAEGWRWNHQISLADHSEAAGEHVASVWGHGQTLLLRRGVWCFIMHQYASDTAYVKFEICPPPPLFGKVHPKHVKEAFRLLNKSIIRVDSPDINFDQEQDDNSVNGEMDSFYSKILFYTYTFILF